MKRVLLSILLGTYSSLWCQLDTVHHGYPVTPFFETHPSTGVFCEFRNTGTANHFHNGVDVPKPDGTPVYSVFDGIVDDIYATGSDAYVRVRYSVFGRSKSDAYVHIVPNPLLHIGDSARAYQTVLGTIVSGQGHTHFTNGVVGAEMNAIRPNGGFVPFADRFPPRILSVRFFMDESETEFLYRMVYGTVDIRVEVADITAADSGSISSSTSNNGAYAVGYKILSADRTTVVYEPPSAGLRFRFDIRPGNSYVGRVFATGSNLSTHIYTVTNGNGADYISSTQVVNPNSWDASALPAGAYTAMVFAQDTRQNADTQYVPIRIVTRDTLAPAAPKFEAVLNDSANRLTVRWYQNAERDVRGYRLYYSSDAVNWSTRETETRLDAQTNSVAYTLGFPLTMFFRLTAVDSATPTNISGFSSVYGIRMNTSSTKTLIVDGCDRRSGVWGEPAHPFALAHARSIPADFSTSTHKGVIEGRVALQPFQVVDWLLADESNVDTTFNASEQAALRSFLRGGGHLIVSGSDIATDLDRTDGPPPDSRGLVRGFFKARLVARNAQNFDVTGVAPGPMLGLALRYGVLGEGSPYDIPATDILAPEPGGSALTCYGAAGNQQYASVGFTGIFPGGTRPGGVVYFAFPFESITTQAARDTLMKRAFQYFELPTGIGEQWTTVPTSCDLMKNHPNPFNPTTKIDFRIASTQGGEFVSVKVYDILGREVATLVREYLRPGVYSASFDGNNFSSGVYYYRLTAGEFSKVRTMMMVK